MLTNEQRNEIVKQYGENLRVDAICRIHSCSPVTVWRTLKRAGAPIKPRGTSRLYQLNEDAFSTLTEESAYWIGFLMADGCIVRQGNSWHVQVGAAIEDRLHIEAFREFIGSNQPARIEQGRKPNHLPMCKLDVCSAKLASDLARYGVVSRKSHTAKAIGLESDRHFWRGAVDGDGCVLLQKRIDSDTPFLGLVGSQFLTAQFARFVRDSIGYPARNRQTGTIYEVRLNFSFAEKMLHVLYDNSAIALQRKAATARAIFAREERIRIKRTERRVCLVEGCGKKRVGRGLCRAHYYQARRYPLILP